MPATGPARPISLSDQATYLRTFRQFAPIFSEDAAARGRIELVAVEGPEFIMDIYGNFWDKEPT